MPHIRTLRQQREQVTKNSLPTKREAKAQRDEVTKVVKQIAKGEAPPAFSRQEVLKQTIAKVNKVHGAGTMILAADAKGLEIQKITTGIVGLDVAMLGGWGLSRLAELAGKFSVGKTTAAYHRHAAFQRKYPENGAVVNINTEMEADTKWMEFNKMDLDRTLIVLPDSGEQAGDVAEDSINMLREGDVLIDMSVDSIASMVPTSVFEKGMEASNMGKQPQLITRFCKKLIHAIKVDMQTPNPKTTVLFLNQIRINIGQLFGDPETTSGGEGKRHWVSQIVFMKQAEILTTPELVVGEGKTAFKQKEAYAQSGRFIVEKNKCHGPRKATGEFTYFNRAFDGQMGGTFDNPEMLLNLAMANEIIVQHTGKKTGMVLSVPVLATTLGSRNKSIEALMTDPALYHDVLTALIHKKTKEFWRKSEDDDDE